MLAFQLTADRYLLRHEHHKEECVGKFSAGSLQGNLALRL